ncbi:MAG: 7,8-didemethyl-8-hydroxy-5-deazariboflavin synthase CofG [Deltaproteobacteria bacterium]|nr:7,8-didemethyl-8-hydroxy-5-deazariboflavin synthase CofG [Deltaproteobacteria bacterium]MCB9786091.1 7,8-didemethyl-8-hydroxy-5-deazariboflavin synthase CofG [Deltaproteobacteria bacterium]
MTFATLPIERLLDGAARGQTLGRDEALRLADAAGPPTEALAEAARARRGAARGQVITYSPKVFLPLTNLCRNFCDYCSFRRSPGDEGAWTMSPGQVVEQLERGRAAGCVEALFCLGDTPESVFPAYRRELGTFGQASTVDHLAWSAREALERGLLPHTNAGILDAAAMERLRTVNVSLGLMLESVSERLCQRGMPHHRAPDKRPARRLAMHEEAGRLRIPFTSGLLIGIGETTAERVDTLLAIRDLDARHDHIQEVIIQNFRAHPRTPMAGRPEPDLDTLARTVALARLLLPDRVHVQAPPNLSPGASQALLDAGLDDLGGISPVTPDYINPQHPWPHLDALAEACAARGLELRPRLPVYERHLDHPAWLDPALRAPCEAARRRLAQVRHPRDLAAAAASRPAQASL